jgi:hypothetical protein
MKRLVMVALVAACGRSTTVHDAPAAGPSLPLVVDGEDEAPIGLHFYDLSAVVGLHTLVVTH